MKKRLSCLAFLPLLLATCDSKDQLDPELMYSATVGTGLDCGEANLLRFDADISSLAGPTLDNCYYEINLPEEFSTTGTRVNVQFRLPSPDELMICTTVGPAYPQIVITRAEAAP